MKLPSKKIGHRDNSANLFVRLGPTVYRNPAELKPYSGNPKKHSKAQIAKISASIREFGFVLPALVTLSDELIAGEARVAAAVALGLDAVPTITIDHLTPTQIRAYRIADNRLAELGEWDRDALRIELEAIIDMGEIDIDVLGWSTGEIDALLSEVTTSPAQDSDDDIPEKLPAISVTGDLWAMGKHRLICGSSRKPEIWETLLAGEIAAMAFTDPPFNIRVNGHVSGTGRHQEFHEGSGEMSKPEFVDFLSVTIGNMATHVRDGGIIDICMDHRHLPELYAAVAEMGLNVLNLCVFNKGSGGMGSLYRSQHELVLITKKGKAAHTNNIELGKHGRNRTNVWDYPGANRFSKTRAADLADHPTVKPLELVADAIRDVTHPGELVLDAFMGSGTTLLAAERTKRKGYGVEIDGGYVDVAIRRWQKMTGGDAVLLETGETFEEVKERRARGCDDPPLPQLALPAPAPRVRYRQRPDAA